MWRGFGDKLLLYQNAACVAGLCCFLASVAMLHVTQCSRIASTSKLKNYCNCKSAVIVEVRCGGGGGVL